MIGRTLLVASMAVCTLATGGCAQRGPLPLYSWANFPRLQYDTLLREGASPQEQIRSLEAHAEKARAEHAALPPGFRAHLGMLYFHDGNATKAAELWRAEKATFPESTAYMDQLLRRLGETSGVKMGEKTT